MLAGYAGGAGGSVLCGGAQDVVLKPVCSAVGVVVRVDVLKFVIRGGLAGFGCWDVHRCGCCVWVVL